MAGGNTAIRTILTVIKFNCLIKREKTSGKNFDDDNVDNKMNCF